MRGPLNEQETTSSLVDSPHCMRMKSHCHRVLIYTTCYNVLDGVTLTIRKLEQEILSSGSQICILTTNSGDPKNTHLNGTNPNRKVIFLNNSVPICFVRDANNPDLTYRVGASLSRMTRAEIEAFEPSIVHITVPDLTAIHLAEFAREKELPLMGTYHSNIPQYLDHYRGTTWLKPIVSGFLRHQYNFFQALYVPTPYMHGHLSDMYKMDRVTNLRVWGRGIDLEKFSPQHRSNIFRQKLGIADTDVVVCWVGRLVPEKRPDIFAHVIRRLHQDRIPYKALVIGSGQVESEIKELPNTIHLGWLDGDQLSTAYASSDIFVFPSAVETFGNVTLEAAASGLPLVVEASCSGHLVDDGKNGFACDADDEDAFYNATRALVLNREMRERFSRAGRNLSLQYEKRSVMQRMVQNYAAVTDEFYYEYGGHHKNRDIAYDNEDSFWGGNHPRNLSLILIQTVALNLLRMAWYVMLFVEWVRKVVEVVRSMRAQDEASMETYRQNVASPSPDKRVCKGKLSHVIEGDLEANRPSLDDDDDTSVTSEGSFSSFSSKPSHGKIHSRASTVAHAGAVVVLKLILFVFRIESRIRNACSVRSRSAWKAKRKRKTSSMNRVVAVDNSSGEINFSPVLERRVRRSASAV